MEEHRTQESQLKDGYTIFVASDGSGLTAERVIQAALTQFEDQVVGMVRYSGVRTEADVCQIVKRAAEERGIVVHTLVVTELRHTMIEEGRSRHVVIHDLLGPLLDRLSSRLQISPQAEPGLFRQLDEEYFRRLESVDYTVKHDDGQHPKDLPAADIVILGVSRTCKTPLSIYLSYRGWRVANVPVVSNVPLPAQVERVDPSRIVALTMDPEQLAKVRTARVSRLGHTLPGNYIDHERIETEVSFARRLYRQREWPIVNVTNKSIEEISTEVLTLVRRRSRK